MSTFAKGTRIVHAGNNFQPRQVILFLVWIALSGAAFVCLDWVYSAVIMRTARKGGNCIVPDPVRHHAFQRNCVATEGWGADSYEVFTNSLGFRDERVREVPLIDTRPRVLILGDSFTRGLGVSWRNSYVGRIAYQFPQYDFLNGAVESYSPSNYLNVARMALAAGVGFDEVIVFIDISDTQDEAAYYRDIDPSGAVTGPERKVWLITWYSKFRVRISRHLLITNYIFKFFERNLVRSGYYHLFTQLNGDLFDMERSAWTYRKVSETEPLIAGYAPLGVEGGIAKEEVKMTLLWQELVKRNIPISVVVYPWPAQVLHDSADSRQVRIWREWCEGKCKRFVSLFAAFLAIKDQCPRYSPGCWYLSHFIFGDTHYNLAGNKLVASVVIDSLESMPPSTAQTIAAARRRIEAERAP